VRNAPPASASAPRPTSTSSRTPPPMPTFTPTPTPTPTREGFGLLGMRERAALVGGTLDAGTDPDGGWTVRLTLPSEPPVSTVPSVPSEPSADSRKDPA